MRRPAKVERSLRGHEPWLVAGLLVTGLVVGCSNEIECGERDLPGTEACPCLPGGQCAADLVCDADICHPRAPDSTTPSDGGSPTGTTDSDTTTDGSGSSGSGETMSTDSGSGSSDGSTTDTTSATTDTMSSTDSTIDSTKER